MARRSWTETSRSLDRFVKDQIKKTAVPGVGVGITLGNRRYANGYGVTNIDHPMPVTQDTLFQIGSTTKTFTATAVMQLVEHGTLDLDVPVRRYLPAFRLKDPEATRKVTLRHLLTHMGGWIGDFFVNTGWGQDALEKVVSQMSRIKQLTPIGTVWSYSNSGFYVAGRIIEKVTRLTFEEAIKEMILDPLEMDHSFFYPHDVLFHSFVVGHWTDGRKSTVAKPWRMSRSGVAAGGLVCSAVDQLKWAAFNMGDGKAPSGKRLLKKSTLQLMQREQVYVGSMTESIGLAWMLNHVDGMKIVRHGGTTNGQLSAFVMVPERKFAVTVLTNSTRGRELHPAVVRWALTNYLGIGEESAAPAMRIEAAELNKYGGQYRIEATGETLDVTPQGRRLILQFPQPSDSSMPAVRVPAIPVQFYEPDKFIGASGPYRGIRGDFLRSENGRLMWMRFGGRLYRRLRKAS
jgi:CubicO group peptidase (beta-lactamase class C family)